LLRAIAENQFELYFQPQSCSDGRIKGVEALIRWNHPERGTVMPAEFIPFAEETGLILAVGRWVLETACAQLVAWADDDRMADLTVAINVSSLQFQQPDFVEEVVTALERAGADPKRLDLELTESLLVKDVDEVIIKMRALRSKGVHFTLDDFGTGYCSLYYLKHMPLDQLKIDRTFVRDLLTDPNDAVIAETIVGLAQTLGLSVIAEGVESAEQRDRLASFGCHDFQGYFFSRPLPIASFEAFLRQSTATVA
jgi:EAL domain-containing protein (putative c-di-GMP-specific phosphodiesterase class I)